MQCPHTNMQDKHTHTERESTREGFFFFFKNLISLWNVIIRQHYCVPSRSNYDCYWGIAWCLQMWNNKPRNHQCILPCLHDNVHYHQWAFAKEITLLAVLQKIVWNSLDLCSSHMQIRATLPRMIEGLSKGYYMKKDVLWHLSAWLKGTCFCEIKKK